MNTYIERTCTEVGDENEKGLSLENFRHREAYVLLGGPGSGKTRSFREEALRTEDGLCLEAHEFAERSPQNEWRDKTLFIDGLDELRASSPSPEPLGLIRAKLDKLGRPRFRLSCRHADWYSALDADDLAKVSRDGRVAKLKLAPLSDSEVGKFLTALNVNEADAFADQAREDGNAPLLRNPLSLEHLVQAVVDGQRPRSRKGVFEASCRSLMREHNLRHARSRESVSFGVEELLDAATHLCAVALLAGKRGYARSPESHAYWIAIREVPGNQDLFYAVLRTRLFEAADDGFAPSHHHIAEFLAGRHLAKRVKDGLPTSRAIALMTGFDGGVVAALRGVWAWFAAHCVVARAELIAADPLATVLYGDVKHFSFADKRRLLDGTRSRSDELFDPPRDGWSSLRWADVATDDAAPLIRDIFSRAPDSEEGQRVALLLADAPERQIFSDLRPLLLSIVRDERLWDITRQKALGWFIQQFQDVPTLEDDLCGLLGDIRTGRVADRDDEITGLLLCKLYPHRVPLGYAKEFFHPPKESALGHYRNFWTTVVREKAVLSDRDEAMRLAAEFEGSAT